MFCATGSTVYPAIREWEEAGVALYSALDSYMKLSAGLAEKSLANGAPPTYLATRIDSALGCFHTTVSNQFSQVQSILARARNQILSPFCHLPEEVLSEIFMHVVFAPLDLSDRRDPTSLTRCGTDSYRALYNMLGVCTAWRKVGLNRGALWSVVPLAQLSTGSLNCAPSVELILQRAKGTSLNLVVDPPKDSNTDHISLVAKHASQFDTVNVITSSIPIIRSTLGVFTHRQGPAPLMLSRLSIYQRHDYGSRMLGEDEDIVPSGLEPGLFDQLVKQLSSIQMRSVFLDWGGIGFSDRLTTFRFQDVMLGYDSEIIPLLKALSSATKLRDLEIIRVNTCHESVLLEDTLARSQILLPNLQSLLIQDLYFNTLRLILLSIQSRSHRLSLVFTRKSLRLNHADFESDEIDTGILSEALSNTPIHALLVDTETLEADEFVLSPDEFRGVLMAMPSLETLWVNIWELRSYYCSVLQRPSVSHESSFPHLINLYFTCVDFPDLEAFKRMINSHADSIQLVAIGGPSDLITEDKVHWDFPEGAQEAAIWLEDNVPEFRRIDRNFEPQEFRHMLWQLW
ncbi:unnamed protein product [Rhizoctonia solani]|uniref:F-box domain-containing protein n=1 Tax=Rhizoctonia solani TaxID=456999 RepID=A0A8H2Y3S7_9AGAM|nr:unnamed protein product [Rhizoctonia solani]